MSVRGALWAALLAPSVLAAAGEADASVGLAGGARPFVNMNFDKLSGPDFQSAKKRNKVRSRLVRRADGVEELEIENQSNFYSIGLSIGSPAQNVTVLVDTGSSDLWVTGSNNPFCSDKASNGDDSNVDNAFDCNEFGVFDVNKSSTYTSNNTFFELAYADTSYAFGTWGQDQLVLQNLNVTGLSFAVANYTNSTVGVLGIGLPGLESTYAYQPSIGGGTKSYQYENFPLLLANKGAVGAYAYSLFLNSPDADSGSVLFGGVDHSKYDGTLQTVPLVNTLADNGFSSPVAFEITMQGVGMTNGTQETTFTTTKIPALLDSGTSLTYLPQAVIDSITKKLNAVYVSKLGYYTMNCPASDDDTAIVFDFGGFQITAPLTDFIITSQQNVCVLGLLGQKQGEYNAILGDSFLEHAYVVYDLENLEISLAQAKFDSTNEDVEAIGKSVPSAVKASGYSNTWVSFAEPTSGGNIFTLSGNSTSGASQTTTASGSNSSSALGSRSSTFSTRVSSSTGSSTASSTKSRNNAITQTTVPSALLILASIFASFFY